MSILKAWHLKKISFSLCPSKTKKKLSIVPETKMTMKCVVLETFLIHLPHHFWKIMIKKRSLFSALIRIYSHFIFFVFHHIPSVYEWKICFKNMCVHKSVNFFLPTFIQHQLDNMKMKWSRIDWLLRKIHSFILKILLWYTLSLNFFVVNFFFTELN